MYTVAPAIGFPEDASVIFPVKLPIKFVLKLLKISVPKEIEMLAKNIENSENIILLFMVMTS